MWEPILLWPVKFPATAGADPMAAFQTDDEPSWHAVPKSNWLPALEKELKSRIGWIDEAVSPFAARTRAAQAAAEVQNAFQPGKAA